MGEIEEAESVIHYTREMQSEINLPPYGKLYFLRSLFIINLLKLEESIKTDMLQRFLKI